MITLSYEQKQSFGFQFLLDAMEPNCVYGQEEIRHAAPFAVEQKEQLEAELQRLTQLVDAFDDSKVQLDRLSLILMKLKEVRGVIERGRDSVLNDLELFDLKQFLLQSEKLRIAYQELSRCVELEGIIFKDTGAALKLLDKKQQGLPGFYIEDAYSARLGEIRERKRQLETALRQEVNETRRQVLLQQRKEQVVLESEEERQVRTWLTVELRPFFDAVFENAKMAGRLDFLIQKAVIARKYGGVCPAITADKLELINMKNPYVQAALRSSGKDFTQLSFAMKKGVAVVTGANMGGKSVALKTVTLNVILALSGFFIYAESGKVPMLAYLCVLAEEFQSLQKGLSSFGGEIVALQKAITQLEAGFGLMVFDELARGTNPDEGTTIVQAVVRFLKNQQVMAIVATHYDHVADFADYHYQVLGLGNADIGKMEAEIQSVDEKKGIEVIAKYMDYGIYPVLEKKDCPREAIHICGLLGLDERVMELMS